MSPGSFDEEALTAMRYGGEKMNKKLTGIVSYLTYVGWIIAYIAGDREGAKFHLNQSLVLAIAGLLCTVASRIPIIGIAAGLVSFLLFLLSIMGFIFACRGEEKELPIIGAIKILK